MSLTVGPFTAFEADLRWRLVRVVNGVGLQHAT